MNAELVNTGPLLRIEDLRISFRTAHGPVLAVNGVSLWLRDNEVVGIVGESGSGKTVTGLSVLGIEPPGARVTGRIWFRDEELRGASPRRLRDIRGASIAMIFQEPMTALNPLMTVGRQVAEVLRRHRGLSGQEARSRVLELFDLVQMPSPDRYLRSYPHQLSGGMRQRVMIAMAVACDPALLIADEPTSALDPTIQAQILGLLSDLRTTLGMSVLLISHDLGVVSRMADHVIVMYAGHVLEQAPTAELLAAPAHPYTTGLLGAVPQPGSSSDTRRLTPIPGQVPLLRAEPEHCVFSPRCAYAEPRCLTGQPALRQVKPGGVEPNDTHQAACVLDHIPDPAPATAPGAQAP
jgi:peptide/nickel transport system ATP-binding protein